MKKPRILVIEDEPDIAEVLRFNLEKAGFQVDEERRGDRALEAIQRTRPDLVVLDLMLPGLDGYEVCRRLRAAPATAAAKIVVVTARAREAERVRGLEEGADAYVTKPFSTRELIATVGRFLGRTPA